MEIVSVYYSKIEELAKEANSVAKELREYVDEIHGLERKLSSGDIAAYDNKGYISCALDEAKRKAGIAGDRANDYSRFSKALMNLCETSKECDESAARSVERVFDAYIGQRTWFQKIGDLLYSNYINFLDKLSGFGPIGEFIADNLKKAKDWIDNGIYKIMNWFKYGDGKYIFNAFMAIVDVAVAIGLFVAAVAAAVSTGPVWLIIVGIVGVVAGSIFLVQQAADSATKIEENAKAYALQRGGNLTAARYYGEIDGFESKTTHYDYGNSTDNEVLERLGKVWDVTKTTSKTVATVCTMLSNIASLGLVENANGETVLDFKRAAEAYKWKKGTDAGFYSNDYQDGGFDANKSLNIFKKVFGHSNEKVFNKIGLDNGIGKVIDGAKSISTMDKIRTSYEKLSVGNLTPYEKVDKTLDIINNIPFVDAFTGDFWKLFSAPIKVVQAFAS